MLPYGRGLVVSAAAALLLLVVADGAYNWQPVVWGGGGYVTGLVFHPTTQGLMYARTDVGGAYRRDPGSRTWIPMLNNINRDDVDLFSIWSMAVDARDSNRIYLAAGMYMDDWARKAALLRSSDRGKTWSRSELPFRLGGNGNGRGTGERLQVDPNNGAVLFLGTTADGLWQSKDYGVTWTKTSCWATAVTFVLIDGSSGWAGASTPHIYVGFATPTGPSLLHSTDSGTTWSAVTNQPIAGQFPLTASADGAGRIYLAYGNALGPMDVSSGSVHVYDHKSVTFRDISPEKATYFGYAGISVSARSPSIITVTSIDRWGPHDNVWRSLNGGRNWVELGAISAHSAPDNAWKREPNMGHWMTDIEIDPFSENHVLYTDGLGLWETDNFLCNKCPWYFNVKGLEETVVSSLSAPAAGDAMLLVTVGDVGGGRWGRDRLDLRPLSKDFGTAHGLDYAHWWPNFMAITTSSQEMAHLSWDNGLTWSPVQSRPVNLNSNTGRIAVGASGGSLVWAIPNNGAYFSRDNGKTWTGSWGYPTSDFYMPVADRTTDAAFYVYDWNKGELSESLDYGKSFGVVYEGLDTMPSYRSRNQILSMPTVQRDLWLATPKGLYHFKSKSASGPTRIADVSEAYGVGYGAAASGSNYPTMYASAKIKGVVGLYQSVDVGQSWTRLNDDSTNWYVDHIVGDPRVFGRLFVALAGRGVMQGTPA